MYVKLCDLDRVVLTVRLAASDRWSERRIQSSTARLVQPDLIPERLVEKPVFPMPAEPLAIPNRVAQPPPKPAVHPLLHRPVSHFLTFSSCNHEAFSSRHSKSTTCSSHGPSTYNSTPISQHATLRFVTQRSPALQALE